MAEIHLAASFGTPEVCCRILDSGISPDLYEEKYATPLHTASLIGRLANVELFLSRGATVDTEDKLGKTPLFYAALKGQVEAMEALLDAGADTEHVDKHGETVLSLVATTTEVSAAQLLLKRGANANHVSTDATTPLNKAIQANNLEMIRALLENGACVESGGPEGCFPLHWANKFGELAVVELLCVFGAHVDAPGSPRMPPIFYAIPSGKVDVARFLLDSSAKMVWKTTTVLHATAMFESPLLMSLFLSYLSNSEDRTSVLVNHVNENGQTPLHIAAEKGDTETVRILAGAGADINIKDNFSKTPLNYAIDENKDDVKEFLLSQGATSSTPPTRTAIIELEDGNTARLSIEVGGLEMSDKELIDKLLSSLRESSIFSTPIRKIQL